MAPAKQRLKSRGTRYAPQTQNDCAADIKKLGDLQRDFRRA
jgi:phage host-nuclease inhibitor protein Gam